jgi:hypothetical protein
VEILFFVCPLLFIAFIVLIFWISYKPEKDKLKAAAYLAGKYDEEKKNKEEEKLMADKYEHLCVRVVGVTYKNENGQSRQTLLRKIKYRDEEFEESLEIETRKYDFEGSPAIGVYVNGLQIGNVPKETVPYIIDNWPRMDTITNIEIIGGGKDEEGERLNYGAEIMFRLFKAVPI